MCAVAAQATAAVASIRLTLADSVRVHGDADRCTHRLARVQAIALRAIAACRTALLGGRRETCDHCGATRITYNSCRNRHCPTCQSQASARWIEARRADLLPIPYFHVVFTLPHALNPLAQGNPRVLYTLLFRAAAETLLTFGRDSRHLGGSIGMTAILHTWSQTLTQHPHVHCLVTGGALSRDHTRWIRGRSAFLFPVKALSIVFRAKYLAGLQRAFDEGALLAVDEFLRRFLVHVLPRGFVRIRHFGFLANRQRRPAIACARHLLSAPTPATSSDDARAANVDSTWCPFCHQGHWHVQILHPVARLPVPVACDTS